MWGGKTLETQPARAHLSDNRDIAIDLLSPPPNHSPHQSHHHFAGSVEPGLATAAGGTGWCAEPGEKVMQQVA
jgi:hypothetical protein